MRLGTFRVVWPETALSFNIHCQALGGDNLVTADGPRVQAREAGPRETAGNERPRLTPHPPESRHIDGDSPTRSSGNRHAEMNRERRGKQETSSPCLPTFFPYKQKHNSDLKSRIALEKASHVFK